ncbi:MAG: hypothetical protein ACR2QM_17460 [Longimicrobiales bacterium]
MPRYYDSLTMLDSGGRQTIELDQENGNVTLGGPGHDGDLSLLNQRGSLNIHLNGERASIIVGGETEDGDLTLRNRDNLTAIHMSGNSGDATFGGRGVNGDVSIYNNDGRRTIRMQGSSGRISVNDTTLDVPDDVLSDEYPLPDIEALSEFIKTRGHLPDIPGESEIHEEGLDLAQFSLDLLKKVEELTLYVIRQHERIVALEKTVAAPGRSSAS